MTWMEKLVVMLTLQMEASIATQFEKQLVLDVIFNRTKKHYMSDGNLINTCLAPFQFSCWNISNFENVKKMLYTLDNDNVFNQLNGFINYCYQTNDISDDSVMYYSPAAMTPAGSLPDWNFGNLKLTISTKLFRFYRLVNGNN